ncbi:TPA: hypothetical protein DCZ36_00665 [Candidatus Gracilibacteria bacterium]|nr:hypothetical protein [Candidatus Gracilibacteria bacterium]
MIVAFLDGGHLTVGLQENTIVPLKSSQRAFCYILCVHTRERTGQILEITQDISLVDTLNIVNLGNVADLTFVIGQNSRRKINKISDIKKPEEILTFRFGGGSSLDLFVFPEYDPLFEEPKVLESYMVGVDRSDSVKNENVFVVEYGVPNLVNRIIPLGEEFKWMRT